MVGFYSAGSFEQASQDISRDRDTDVRHLSVAFG
jgi:hypothetical protein